MDIQGLRDTCKDAYGYTRPFKDTQDTYTPYKDAYVGIHVRMRMDIHTCMHAYIHTCMHTYMHACMHIYMHTYIHACMHTYIHTCMHTCMHACMHTYMQGLRDTCKDAYGYTRPFKDTQDTYTPYKDAYVRTPINPTRTHKH
jgi:hypothetical protein